ncbi:haloacid dehalogenase [Rhodococcoides trifolii]|uniref:Haloacid dehalogenase n=1 Tax=Rhodococcoides trifolii TaxID=908250 RepID=A0A917G5J1_9NOCA|nr:HAD family hydrolase [Rhodococcus trifolii]GGG23949.1 haloacid dehalogenase [Rhodococcus trifolii]
MPSAALFDIDGTLVDSNYAHIGAWSRAFREAGRPVPSWRIHSCIGMDGSLLLEALVGSADSDEAQRAKDLHDEYYAESGKALQVLPGARELLSEVRSRGMTVVLATSAPENELAILRDLLEVEDIVSVVTSAEDAEVAKPRPDVVRTALERSGASAHEAVFIGDSIWDMKACTSAEVVGVGVRSGGIAESELLSAGAHSVFDDAADLLRRIDSSPLG